LIFAEPLIRFTTLRGDLYYQYRGFTKRFDHGTDWQDVVLQVSQWIHTGERGTNRRSAGDLIMIGPGTARPSLLACGQKAAVLTRPTARGWQCSTLPLAGGGPAARERQARARSLPRARAFCRRSAAQRRSRPADLILIGSPWPHAGNTDAVIRLADTGPARA